ALNENTADGFVFRVDMRLRPNGESGPLALSFEAMEHYYQLHGRDWERYAFVKARVVAGDRAAGAELLATLKPFVYRKYLDYGAIESIRTMKAMIEREMARQGMNRNIKLGRGGIREIEFIVQTHQLIRGGREPSLQEPNARRVLAVLRRAGYLKEEAATRLDAAYVFLRDVEHRLQMAEDQQTQRLPDDELGQLRLAFASGFDDWTSFLATLDGHRLAVHEQFSALFRQAGEAQDATDPLVTLWQGALDDEAAGRLLREQGYAESGEVLALLQSLRTSGAYLALSTTGRERVDRVVPMILAQCGHSPTPLATLQRLMQVLEAIGRRTAYFALMVENPPVVKQLVSLAGASPWIANWIARHPLLLDELLNPALARLPEPAQLRAELRERLAQLPADDLELQMEVLREFRHGYVLRVAAADLGAKLDPLETGSALAAIADTVVGESLRLAERDLQRRHGRPCCAGRTEPPGFADGTEGTTSTSLYRAPRLDPIGEARAARRDGSPTHPARSSCLETEHDCGFAVIGYGKLGSRELGYGSDLDMIFLYEGGRDGGETDGDRPLPNESYFARLGQRLIHLLTTRTAGGLLYEVDMRLRPSGKSGPLVASLDSFEHYQLNEAWTWEHQALVRARPVTGNPAVIEAFGRLREAILCRPRDPAKLAQDVRDMRTRMLETRDSRETGLIDLKHDRGGIVDIEFMVQYWVLRWAAEHPVLIRQTDNIHILQALAGEGLLDPKRAAFLEEGYRRYLSLEHHLKLQEQGSLLQAAQLGDLPERVRQVWKDEFNEE
ncbi:MAG: bifunctional [glutamate--ammonia ligase]-adenylyl-L-tyrosine phosphorylase/[glutamate--ammonia-ligase] adenylyltransferase, partial [Pseudomonadota bacterium]